MNIINNIKNFLYDQKYFISIYDEKIHLFNYETIIKFSDQNLIFKFELFKLIIKGEKLIVKKLFNNEVLIDGLVESVNFDYE